MAEERIDGTYAGRRSERERSDVSELYVKASVRNLKPEAAFGFSDHFW